jgi:hypothetical protein
MGALDEGRLRANPDYELVLLDRLGEDERLLVGELDDDVYGVLRPRREGLEPRTASTDTALLLLTLAQPGPLPGYVRARLGGDLEETIGRLVLDGVLELERDGGFVSGAAAAAALLPGRSAGGRGRSGDLSLAALRYGQELGPLPESLLALRMYLYGRRPVGPALRERWPDENAVAGHLGILPGGRAHAALARGWVEAQAGEGEGRAYWRSWHPRRLAGSRPARGGSSYKLYVSPAPDDLPRALTAIAEALSGAAGLSGFKVGRDVHGICRPDKLVVYFDRLDDLRRAAASLGERLDGCAPQGVPFSAPIDAGGLLSWGSDPPPAPGAGPAGSWRLWIAERLAEYLARARREGGELEPWRFALERLGLAGVDVDTWAPRSGIWPAAGAPA